MIKLTSKDCKQDIKATLKFTQNNIKLITKQLNDNIITLSDYNTTLIDYFESDAKSLKKLQVHIDMI